MLPAENKGFTLIEVIIAAVILAIITLVAVSAFLTMGNVFVKADDSKSADSSLEEAIASEAADAGYTTKTDLPDATLEFDGYSIPLDASSYSSNKTGQGFTVFKLAVPSSNP